MNFQEVLEQLTRLYYKLNKKQKVVIGVVLFVVIGFIAFVIVYTKSSNDENYATLFDRLSDKNAGLIVQELEKQQIDYKIPTDGTIQVPKDEVYKLRMSLASSGLLKDSSVGYELFDKQEFGATDFDQKIKYLRALEGELSKTIASLEPIENAKVHIALPKDSVFVSKKIPPSASIVVKIAENKKLKKNQILGIKNLVAASVPELKLENVKLIDIDGEPLEEGEKDGYDSETIAKQISYKKRIESLYEQKIVSVLAPFIGRDDRVVAKVTIDFDFSQRNSTKEYYDPENVVRSEQTLEEKKEGFEEPKIGGVPGAVSNIGPVQGLKDNKLKNKYEKSQATTNYEVSKTVSSIKGPFAVIKRVSAAVVVDGSYVLDDNGKMVYKPRSSEELRQIESLVKRAIGYSENRADQASVSNFQFEGYAKEIVESPYNFMLKTVYDYLNPITPILKFIFLVIVLFIFYKKVIVPFSERMLEIPVEEEEEYKFTIDLDEEEEESLTEKFSQMRKKVEEQLGLTDEFDEDELKYEVLLEKMIELTEEKPEEVAALISALIRDETEMGNDAASQISGGKK